MVNCIITMYLSLVFKRIHVTPLDLDAEIGINQAYTNE